MKSRVSQVLFVLLLLGCEAGFPGELIVGIRTDLAPDLDFATVETELFSSDDESLAGLLRRVRPALLDGGEFRIAEYTGLMPGGYRLAVRLRAHDGLLVANRNLSLEVRAEGPTAVTVVVTRSCRGTVCPGASDPEDYSECVGGVCVSPECTPENPLACATACVADAECSSTVSCAPAACVDGFCITEPDHERCDDGEYCDSGRGCTVRPPPCSDATCVAQPCEAAECVEGRCVISSLCAADQVCCNGECALPGCDDRNPCTEDSCGGAGCENTPVEGACDDDDFCNGTDSCVAGACTQHSGDPCTGDATCDAASRLCIGCAIDSDCGGVVTGNWTTCSGFVDTCDSTGSRTRTSRSFTCEGGSCIADETIEMGPCSRSVEGFSCGSFGRSCSGGVCRCATGGVELCANGIDDDCDGQIDCRDSGCRAQSCDDANVCTRNETCQSDGSCGGALPGVGVRRCRTDRDGFFWIVDGSGSCSDMCSGVDEGIQWRIPEGGTSSVYLQAQDPSCGSTLPDLCRTFYLTSSSGPDGSSDQFCSLGPVGRTYYLASAAPGTSALVHSWSATNRNHYMGFVGTHPPTYSEATRVRAYACPP